tara:strand:- start:1392 stop:1592 length:201 start_codon:yes stop_codon:yes gene_type:complete
LRDPGQVSDRDHLALGDVLGDKVDNYPNGEDAFVDVNIPVVPFLSFNPKKGDPPVEVPAGQTAENE